MQLDIRTIKLGSAYLAVTTIGGVTIRGGRGDNERIAVQSLLHRLSQTTEDDAVIGLELALEGHTLAELESGDL